MSEEVQKSPDFLPTEDVGFEEVQKFSGFCQIKSKITFLCHLERLLRSFSEAEKSRDLKYSRFLGFVPRYRSSLRPE